MASVLEKIREAHAKGDKLQVFVEYLAVLDSVISAIKTDQNNPEVEYLQDMVEWQISLKSKLQNLYSQLLESKSEEEIIKDFNDLEATFREGEEKYNVRVEQQSIKE